MFHITKRDNTTEQYNSTKIEKALEKAFLNSNTPCDKSSLDALVSDIDTEIKTYFAKNDTIHIEDIQDIVEKELMNKEYYATAKHYIQYRFNRNEKRKMESYISKIPDNVETPWGMLGYVTYKRTYSRRIDDNDPNKTEEFRDTILRVLDACQKQLNVGFTNEELKNAYTYFMSLKCSVAGRFLWQLGTETVSKQGLLSLQNCAFTNIDEPIAPFLWIFDCLLLGTGVGFNVQRCHISKLPNVLNTETEIKITRCDTKDADFIIPDSREGWISFLEKVLEAFYIKGKSFTYSTILIRGAGALIKGFGGVASGPEELVKGMNNIVDILNKKRGQKLSSVECLDIINIIASIVVSGNVRRSALLAIGDYDDIEYLNAKRWDLGNIPNWRCMSNNSVACSDTSKLPEEFWRGYMGNGEPYGLINLDLSRKIGRTKDGDKYPDPEVDGYNPCAEISLPNRSTCCLSEIILPNVKSFDELEKMAKILYRICKHSILLPCHQKSTEDIVHKEMRIGIGITGYMQCTEEQKGWLDPLYEKLREYDVYYSEKLGIPKSIKLTTCKPSGTLSILPGVTPGCHPGIFQYFIRRIRISSNNSLVKLCKKCGYKVEYQQNFDGTDDVNTMVVEFPCMYPIGTVLAKDMNAIAQLEVIKKLQHDWSDNAVSVTVYYRLEELEDIKKWLNENYTDGVKSCSFLLHYNHNFKQAPYEEITKEEYDRLMEKVTPIVSGNIQLDDSVDYSNETCKGGVCPIR